MVAMGGVKVPAHLPAVVVVVVVEEEVSLFRGNGGGGNSAAVLCTGCMDGLAEGAPLTVACLPACLPAFARQPISLAASNSPDFLHIHTPARPQTPRASHPA